MRSSLVQTETVQLGVRCLNIDPQTLAGCTAPVSHASLRGASLLHGHGRNPKQRKFRLNLPSQGESVEIFFDQPQEGVLSYNPNGFKPHIRLMCC